MASVLLVESYYGGSHRSWVDAWTRHSSHDISLVTHPDQFWRWRLRGGAVTLAEQVGQHIEANGRPDVLVVSGMVDVASLIGHARRALGDTPVAVYVHESQILYPLAPNQRPDTGLAMINWQSLVASDAVWFNSAFHRDALRPAVRSMLNSQPEPRHTHLVGETFEKAHILWPGVETIDLIERERTDNSTPRVLWNQRWDHDKNPHAVFSALAKLASDGVAFTLALAGQNQRPDNPELEWLQQNLGDRIDHLGFLPAPQYRELLLSSDVVVSAADHEFFGIALVEAIAAGAVPVLPNRLSFPELIEPRWHDTVLYADGGLRTMLGEVLGGIDEARQATLGLRGSMARFDASHAAAEHDRAVDQLVASS